MITLSQLTQKKTIKLDIILNIKLYICVMLSIWFYNKYVQYVMKAG